MFIRKDYLGYNGCIYQKVVGGDLTLYRRLELYLPSATGTYNEPIETTFTRLVDALENKELKPSFADGLRYQWLPDQDRLVPYKKVAV